MDDKNVLGLKYFPENFNFMFSVLNYSFEREKNPAFKTSIYNLIRKIEACHNWLLEDRKYITIECNASDLSVINYCYENLFMETYEAQQRMYGKTDYFRVMYEEDLRRGQD